MYILFRNNLSSLMALTSSCGRPPDLSQSEVSSVVCKYFNFSAVDKESVKALVGYDDRNYYFQGTNLVGKTNRFIIKISNNVHISFLEVEGCCEIIQALHAGRIIRQAPEKSRSDQAVVQLHFNDLKQSCGNGLGKETPPGLNDMTYAVSILSFVEGELFDEIDKKYLVPEVMKDIGVKLGTMDKILKVFIVLY